MDLIIFAFIALMLSFPFGSIYLILKLLNWNQQRKLFSDSWIIYLSWLVSSFLAVLFTNGFQRLPLAIVVLVFANTLTIAFVLWAVSKLRAKQNNSIDIFGYEYEKVMIENKQRSWKASFLVSVSAILTMSAIFTVMFFADNLIERINPKPKNSFGIYDI